MKNSHNGFFITFEGPDGSGKTSVIKVVEDWLKKNDYNHLITKEPGSKLNKICQQIRELILNPDSDIDKKTELFLMLADRCNHVNKVILPALQEGKIIISDRFIDSTLAYQGYGRRFGDPSALEIINLFNNYSISNTFPDLTFIIIIDPEIGLQRATTTEFGKKDRFEQEKLQFHQRVCEGYEDIYNLKEYYNRDIVLINSTDKSINEVAEIAIKNIENRIK
jgi:dTMP kinase